MTCSTNWGFCRGLLRLLLLFTLPGFVKVMVCSYYTSNTELRHLFHSEVELMAILDNITSQGNTIERYCTSSIPVFSSIKNNVLITSQTWTHSAINNPINQFFLLYKFAFDWLQLSQKVAKLLISEETLGLASRNAKVHLAVEMLTAVDGKIRQLRVEPLEAKKAARALLRLQGFYDLKTKDIIEGRVRNYNASRSFKECEIQYMISTAFKRGDNCRTSQWVDELFNLGYTLPKGVSLSSIGRPAVEYCDSITCSLSQESSPCFFHDDVSRNYTQLCNGKYPSVNKQETLVGSGLTCFLHAPHPVLVLQPVRVERLSLNPPVFQLHQVFTHRECDALWEKGEDKQAPSTIVSVDSGIGRLESDIRVGTNAWVEDEDFAKRVSYVTGLDSSTSEPWQVGSYGIGGHYMCHWDYFTEDASQYDNSAHMGNRMITFMTYLSDVEEGGATAFPHLGVSVFPTKGSAVFWFNLDLKGDPLPLTIHGGCSVLVGLKKIANKWIRYNGQFQTYPCGLSPNSYANLNPSLLRY